MTKVKSEKVAEVGIVREEGWLYFIDKDGDISRILMELPKKKKRKKKTRNVEENSQ